MNLLQNNNVKSFLQNTVFRILNVANKCFKHDDNTILLYINTDLRESNKTILDYLIDNGYNKKYNIICSCNNPEKFSSIVKENVIFTNRTGGVKAFFRASKVFYSIGKIPIIPAKDQLVMQMWHGIPLKGINEGWRRSYSIKRQHFTHLLVTSKTFVPLFCDIFSTTEDRMFICGYPRSEGMLQGNPHYDFGDYDKLILWAPTFRKSTDNGMKEMSQSNTVVPVLSPDEFEEMNDFLKSINVKLVIKLHPMQDISGFNFKNMDNFKLLTHNEFLAKGMDLYRFAAQSDAMITDYSSILFDYLMLNRPMGFTTDDEEMYGQERGFSLDPELYRPGQKIKTKEDLKAFCKNLVDGVDLYSEKRQYVNKLANDYTDGHFTERVLKEMKIYI